MKGVTLAAFRKYYGASMTAEDLKKITSSQWRRIFKDGYWDKVLADRIASQSVANLLVDWVWMSGVATPVKTIQRLAGVEADGSFGPRTLSAVNDMDPNALFEDLKKKRILYYDRIIQLRPANAKFRKGWLNRLNDYKYIG